MLSISSSWTISHRPSEHSTNTSSACNVSHKRIDLHGCMLSQATIDLIALRMGVDILTRDHAIFHQDEQQWNDRASPASIPDQHDRGTYGYRQH